MIFSTIIAAPIEASNSMRAVFMDDAEPSGWYDEFSNRLFRIRAADSAGHRSSANILVERMYAWRGYRSTAPARQIAGNQRLTLVATDHEETIGTLTVGFDGPDGLLVDDLFGDEAEGLRAQGKKVCEFTKLAMDSAARSSRVLASLFHVAYIYAHRIHGCDRLLIEVNPRHVRFYEKMLGFRVLGPERMNRRVNAPGVLLCLDFEHAREQIALLGGRGCEATVRSLYPLFFSPEEEAGIIARVCREAAPAARRVPPPYERLLQHAA